MSRRILWYGLGVLWIIDGLLQAQPGMFTNQFVTSILQPSAQGQPGWLAGPLAVGMALWQRDMVLANSGALLVQLLIGALILSGWRRPWGRVGLALSTVWGLGVWIFGEGLGMLAMGGMTVLTGIPGSVLIYVLSAGLLLLPERWWASGAVSHWTRRALGVFWLLVALAQAWPGSGFWTADGLGGIFQGAAETPQPAFLAAPIAAVAAAVASAPVVWNGAFVAIMAAIGVAFLLGVRSRWLLGLTLLWLLFVWWMGQDFGALFSGMSTDPNTALPLALLTIAVMLPPGREAAAAAASGHRMSRHVGRTLPVGPGAARAAAAFSAGCGLALLRRRRAHANGGKVEVADRPAGPYRVTITASPNPLRVGGNDLSVLVSAGDDASRLIPDATVTLLVAPADGRATPAAFPATHADATNKLYYAANVPFPTAGRWLFTVQVAGPAGRGTVRFSDDVSPAVLGMTPVQMGCSAIPALALAAIVAGELKRLVQRARANPGASESEGEGYE